MFVVHVLDYSEAAAPASPAPSLAGLSASWLAQRWLSREKTRREARSRWEVSSSAQP